MNLGYKKLVSKRNKIINAEESLLTKLYSDSTRHYHNKGHIRHCFDEFEEIKDLCENPDQLRVAMLYHDAVHNPEENNGDGKTNEEKSAELAYDFCRRVGYSACFAKKVSDLILFTRHDSIPEDIEGKFLVDIDLAILGSTQQKFDEYERDIRKEYPWVPQDKFNQVRAEILQRFLDRKNIYFSDFFRNKYEVQAKANLERSLEKLRETSSAK